MPYKNQILDSYQFIIDKVNERCGRKKYTLPKSTINELILSEAERYRLSENAVKGLARELNIEFIARPHVNNGQYSNWEPSICKKFKCIKYSNPSVHVEYIVMLHRYKIGSVDYLYHSPQGHQTISWFANLLSSKDNIIKPSGKIIDPDQFEQMHKSLIETVGNKNVDFTMSPYRGKFSNHINKHINQQYSHVDPYIIRALHGLFDIHVPEVDGVCSKCFQAKFLNSGHGVSYQKVISDFKSFEIRISAIKTKNLNDSKYHPAQHRIYVTNTLVEHGQEFFIQYLPGITPTPIPILKPTSNDMDALHMIYFRHNQTNLNKLLGEETLKNEIIKHLKTKKSIELALCTCK